MPGRPRTAIIPRDGNRKRPGRCIIWHRLPFNTTTIRVVTLDGNPWLVGKDVCDTLNLFPNKVNGSYQQHFRRLHENERILVTGVEPTVPNRRFSAISEGGLYRLIMRSDKPEAKAFQDWVTRVVLPAIRKDGGYILGEERVASGEMSEDELVSLCATFKCS